MDCSNWMQRWRKGATPVLKTLTLLALALLVAACRGKASDPAATQAQPVLSGPVVAVKLMVETDGIYTVPAAALRSAGFDLTAVSPETLALTHAGRPVAFQVVGQGKNRTLRFYGQAPAPTAYASQSVYWLAPTSGRPGGDCRAVGSPSRPSRQRRSPRRQSSRPQCVPRSRSITTGWLRPLKITGCGSPSSRRPKSRRPSRRRTRPWAKPCCGSAWSPIPPRPSILTTTSSSRSTAPRLQTKSGMASARM